MVMANWRNMIWEVSPQRIKPIMGVSIGKSIEKDRKNDRDGSNPSNVKGYQAQTIPLAYEANKTVGVDPLKELQNWKQQIGKTGQIYLGGKRYGHRKMQLDQIDFTTDTIDSTGTIISATISLNFVQSGIKNKDKIDTTKKPTGIQLSGNNDFSSAFKVGRSKTDKKEKMMK